MSRWSQQDSDEGRLPEGMQRVGYDADTRTYSYQDEEGNYWEGAPGVRYGELHRSGSGYTPMTMESEQAMRRSNSEAWRYMLPFFLLVSVTLLALYRFLGSAGTTTIPFVCAEDSVRYSVKSGDSCWAIANDHGITVADLIKLNQDVDCNLLQAGRDICVPVLK